jgi:hypothetical protein
VILAVDFDGTIAGHKFSEIGEEIPFALETLKLFQKKRHKRILWIYRSGKEREEAIEVCEKRGLYFTL